MGCVVFGLTCTLIHSHSHLTHSHVERGTGAEHGAFHTTDHAACFNLRLYMSGSDTHTLTDRQKHVLARVPPSQGARMPDGGWARLSSTPDLTTAT